MLVRRDSPGCFRMPAWTSSVRQPTPTTSCASWPSTARRGNRRHPHAADHTTRGWSRRGTSRALPKTSVVLLSQYLEPRYAQRLLADHPAGSATCSKSASPTSPSSSTPCAGSPRRVRARSTIVSRLMQRRRPAPRSPPDTTRAGHPHPDGRGPLEFRHRRASWRSASEPSRRRLPSCSASSALNPPRREPSRNSPSSGYSAAEVPLRGKH